MYTPIKLSDTFIQSIEKIKNPNINVILILAVAKARFVEGIYKITDKVLIARCKNPKFLFLMDFLKNNNLFEANYLIQIENFEFDNSEQFNRITYGGLAFCFDNKGIDAGISNHLI